jgi:hypothetical protein
MMDEIGKKEKKKKKKKQKREQYYSGINTPGDVIFPSQQVNRQLRSIRERDRSSFFFFCVKMLYSPLFVFERQKQKSSELKMDEVEKERHVMRRESGERQMGHTHNMYTRCKRA